MQGSSITMGITSRGWIWPSPSTGHTGLNTSSSIIRIYGSATSANDSTEQSPLLYPSEEKEEDCFPYSNRIHFSIHRAGNLTLPCRCLTLSNYIKGKKV